MSEAKHTPWPWSVTDNSWEYSSVYGPADELVAECPISSDVDEDTQDEFEATKEANARLIAAAPDFMEAALRYIAQIDAIGLPDDEVTSLFRAAIAKAEGRS